MTKRTNQPRLFEEMDERERYERDLFTAICTACGYPLGQLTRTARGRVLRAVKELAEIKATVKQVDTVARGLLAAYKTDGVVTPQSITGNWPKFVAGTAADKRESRRAEMDACFDRVAGMEQSDVEAIIVQLKSAKPAAWGCDYRDTQVPSDDSKRLCVRICDLLDAEASR